MNRRVVFRVDGNSVIGMGHVIRCIALAEMLKNDYEIVFAIQDKDSSIVKNITNVTEKIIFLFKTIDFNRDSRNFSKYIFPSDFVVLDGYNFDGKYQSFIKKKCFKLICIDDTHDTHFFADAVINHAIGINESDYSKETYCKLYLGIEYLMLRKEFFDLSIKSKKIIALKKVFLSMGSSDFNNLTCKFAEAIIQTNNIPEIHLLLGNLNQNIKSIDILIDKNKHVKIFKYTDISALELIKLLKISDLSICPASTISLECCSIGMGIISGYSAENQLENLKGLKANNAIINIGNFNLLNSLEIKKLLNENFSDLEKINSLIENQKKIFDGLSSKRLLKIFKNLDKDE